MCEFEQSFVVVEDDEDARWCFSISFVGILLDLLRALYDDERQSDRGALHFGFCFGMGWDGRNCVSVLTRIYWCRPHLLRNEYLIWCWFSTSVCVCECALGAYSTNTVDNWGGGNGDSRWQHNWGLSWRCFFLQHYHAAIGALNVCTYKLMTHVRSLWKGDLRDLRDKLEMHWDSGILCITKWMLHRKWQRKKRPRWQYIYIVLRSATSDWKLCERLIARILRKSIATRVLCHIALTVTAHIPNIKWIRSV